MSPQAAGQQRPASTWAWPVPAHMSHSFGDMDKLPAMSAWVALSIPDTASVWAQEARTITGLTQLPGFWGWRNEAARWLQDSWETWSPVGGSHASAHLAAPAGSLAPPEAASCCVSTADRCPQGLLAVWCSDLEAELFWATRRPASAALPPPNLFPKPVAGVMETQGPPVGSTPQPSTACSPAPAAEWPGAHLEGRAGTRGPVSFCRRANRTERAPGYVFF